MRIDGVTATLRSRLRHPGRGAVLLLLGIAWAGLRLLLDMPYGRFGVGEAFIPLALLLGSYCLAPIAWQWTGDDRAMAGPARGLFQSLAFNSAWLLLLGLLFDPLGNAGRPPQPPRSEAGPALPAPAPVASAPPPRVAAPITESAGAQAPTEIPTEKNPSATTPPPEPATQRPEEPSAKADARPPRGEEPPPEPGRPHPRHPPPGSGRKGTEPPEGRRPPPERRPPHQREALLLAEDPAAPARRNEREGPPPPPPPASPELFIFSLGLIVATVLGRSLAEGDHAQAREDALLVTANQAKALALQSQMQPHALFNALSGLVELVHEDPQATEDALVALCDYLRRLMAHSRGTGGQLSAERELLENYLRMEQIRLGDRLQIQWNWPAWANRLRVPPLLIQPLVENAIVHGISPASEGGELQITLYRQDRSIHVEVANTGRPPNAQKDGTGMGHLKERLALWHPGACFTLTHDQGWTRAHILLPEPLPPC